MFPKSKSWVEVGIDRGKAISVTSVDIYLTTPNSSHHAVAYESGTRHAHRQGQGCKSMLCVTG